MIEGYYYLHQNGDLIFKRELGDTVADLRESDFVRAFWPVDPEDREGAWRIVVEATALGARPDRVAGLAAQWGCNDQDACAYANRVGTRLRRDGDQWCATRRDFQNLQESPAGFGPSGLEAMANLAKQLGLKPSKMWGGSFRSLLEGVGHAGPDK